MGKLIKITSGEFRGRSIKSPDSTSTHPMGAREKLALFNMVSGRLPGAHVLDAFAGSGALGIEALSRGATDVVFVEKYPQICQTIRQNLNLLGARGQVVCCDVASLTTNDCFDLILADPPYGHYREYEVARLADFLTPNGVLALSHPCGAPILPRLKLQQTRKYANAHISIYTKAPDKSSIEEL